jgi:DNA-3-methyladenine glycosylase II
MDLLILPAAAAKVLPPDLYTRLALYSPLCRAPTPTIWEAAATAVIRQVVHRDHARVVFHRLCAAIGQPATLDGRIRHAFPTAHEVLAAGDAELRKTGMGFKAATLLRLARWASEGHDQLPSDELYTALTSVRGIGRWTASVALCDARSDFSYYPIDDLAVRAQARASWASAEWPDDAGAFADAWSAATAPHTPAITGFVLAYGVLSAAATRVH